MAQQQTFDVLTMARAYVASGLSLIPIERGTKEPARALLPRVYNETTDTTRSSWKLYQERLPHEHELVRWFGATDAGIAIVCGGVSGGLVVLDVESLELYDRWHTLAQSLIDPTILSSLPVVASGKGRHVYFRMADPPGNRKLALRERLLLAETRGQGGYILAPPSLHPSGKAYDLLNGDLCSVPLLSDDTAHALLDAARALAPVVERPRQSETEAGGDVIGAFNRAHTIEAVLEARGYCADRTGRYIRPSGQRGSVVVVDGRSVHYNTADPLYSEAPGGGNHSHTPFSAWCILEHGGDVKAAVREAARQIGLSRTQLPTDDVLTAAGRVLGLGNEASDTWPYFVQDDTIWMHQHDKDGTPKAPMPLCNFIARITTETLLDDGEHQEEWYTLVATCQHRTRTMEIRRAEFESEGALSRIVAALGARARVNPRTQPKFVLDAIKVFSLAVQERVIHTHTGWVNGRYLFANGAVDADGWHPHAGCQLPKRLQSYHLSPTGAITDALALFDQLLELAPAAVMVPLLGGALLAPILDSIDAPAPMVHLYGPTGSFKTSVSCAVLELWGHFLPAQPTDSWTSTSNSIQRLGWYLKDAPMLLDDYKIAHVKPQYVTFLLQNYGDNMARGRLDANSEVRSVFPMRCVLLSSGEDQPDGEASTLARILSVQLARRAVHRDRLTALQQHGHLLHHISLDYLTWLAAGADTSSNSTLHQTIRTAILGQLEDALDNATNPGRIASNVAVLYVAWETFGRFLAQRGHWSTERVQQWLLTCKRELITLARAQLNLTTQERYSRVFLETVRGLIASGKAVLQNLDNNAQEILTSQVLIGAYDRAGTYLIAQTSYDEVCKHMRAAGRTVSFSLRALSQMLHQDGLLQATEETSLVMKKRINGTRPYCWHLPLNIFDM